MSSSSTKERQGLINNTELQKVIFAFFASSNFCDEKST